MTTSIHTCRGTCGSLLQYHANTAAASGCILRHLQMHALPVAVQPTARQQLWVPNMLLVARLFQALPRLTELKLAAPAAVVFAAIRFWCAACSDTQSTLRQHVCSHGDRAHQIRAAAAAVLPVLNAVLAGQYACGRGQAHAVPVYVLIAFIVCCCLRACCLLQAAQPAWTWLVATPVSYCPCSDTHRRS